ncbi:MAG TPA: 2-oxoacid:acceptor oxidoreductase subunit alpha [Thermoanaerobaculaceae bacterium]|nr:2-oxoacid:acceptor oxidoreductase subunit alpha [Thermoanaerobaculaceae bacterium]
MSVNTLAEPSHDTAAGVRVNDFAIRVATVNGTGSQSANQVLLRTLFQMGVTVTGKNLFPSNIAGLPTWFTIRLNPRGYFGSKREYDVLVAFNPETAAEDLDNLAPGGTAVVDVKLKLGGRRADVTIHEVPFGELAAACCPDVKLRKLVANMVYVGVLAHQLGLEAEEVERAIGRQFAAKSKAVELNVAAVRAGREWAASHLPPEGRFRAARVPGRSEKILIEGNAAAAYGAIFGGASVVAWYPITPSSSFAEALIEHAPGLRTDPATGKATYAIVQAEDELAALGMVLGAGWAGARALTATSGPGISLMAEFAGLGYFTEIPAVVIDVQRVGPSTGMPTRTSQGDVLSLAYLSHGDTQHPLLFPAGPREYFADVVAALDAAAVLQTPVFVAADLDLGMNFWMDDPFDYPPGPIAHGKVLSAEDLGKLGGFSRYLDIDGDGIGYRTVPGTPHPKAAYFLRGSGHTEQATYSERGDDYEKLMARLKRKVESNLHLLPAPIVESVPGAEVGVIAYGTSHWATVEARDRLAAAGTPSSYLRVRSWPFAPAVREFVAAHERVYVVEQNRDGQLAQLLQIHAPDLASRVRSVAHCDGLPLTVEAVEEGIAQREGSA